MKTYKDILTEKEIKLIKNYLTRNIYRYQSFSFKKNITFKNKTQLIKFINKKLSYKDNDLSSIKKLNFKLKDKFYKEDSFFIELVLNAIYLDSLKELIKTKTILSSKEAYLDILTFIFSEYNTFNIFSSLEEKINFIIENNIYTLTPSLVFDLVLILVKQEDQLSEKDLTSFNNILTIIKNTFNQKYISNLIKYDTLVLLNNLILTKVNNKNKNKTSTQINQSILFQNPNYDYLTKHNIEANFNQKLLNQILNLELNINQISSSYSIKLEAITPFYSLLIYSYSKQTSLIYTNKLKQIYKYLIKSLYLDSLNNIDILIDKDFVFIYLSYLNLLLLNIKIDDKINYPQLSVLKEVYSLSDKLNKIKHNINKETNQAYFNNILNSNTSYSPKFKEDFNNFLLDEQQLINNNDFINKQTKYFNYIQNQVYNQIDTLLKSNLVTIQDFKNKKLIKYLFTNKKKGETK